MKPVQTHNAPVAIGPYAQGVVVGNLLFTSGQIALRPDGSFAEGTIAVQTAQVLNNIQGIVEEAGCAKDNVIKTTVFLKNLDDFTEMNKVYEAFFGTHRPARSTVQVAKLPRDALVEIEAIAELS